MILHYTRKGQPRPAAALCGTTLSDDVVFVPHEQVNEGNQQPCIRCVRVMEYEHGGYTEAVYE